MLVNVVIHDAYLIFNTIPYNSILNHDNSQLSHAENRFDSWFYEAE